MFNCFAFTILVLAMIAGDTIVYGMWHPPELQMNYSNWANKEDRLTIYRRPHLDVWITDKPPVKWFCVMSPCRTDRRAGDMRE